MANHVLGKKTDGKRRLFFLAACSGLMLTLSFPNAGIPSLAWIALVPLIAAIRQVNGREAFRLGLTMGIVHNLTLMYWLAETMHTYGQLPWSLCGIVLVLFSFYLAIYPALFCWLLNRMCGKPVTLLWAVPVFWVTAEYLRSILFTGFPWELLAYSQFQSLHLIQISDIFGVFGVSMLLALSNALASMLLFRAAGWTWNKQPVSTPVLSGAALVFLGILALTLVYGSRQINVYRERIAGAPKVQVRVVQGNIPQEQKWDPVFARQTVEKYIALSRAKGSATPDLVVWPETATPFYFLSEKELTDRVLDGIRQTGAAFLLGSPVVIPGPSAVRYHNSAYLISARKEILGRYDKTHLVPFGEYVPLRRWLPFVGKMVQQVGDFHPGVRGKTLTWQNTEIGVLICYEIIFPELARKAVQKKARLLVNLTNDAWYGMTSAPYQHFSMAVFRAVENKRSLVRAANTGISGFIDPVGNIAGETALFADAVTSRSMPLLQSDTVYTRTGDVLPAACAAFSLASIGVWALRRRKRAAHQGTKQ